MTKVEPRTLRGFRDYLPSKMIPRQRMLSAIEATFQRFGFVPLMTPALEYLDILTGKYGDEGEFLSYTLPAMNRALQALGRVLRAPEDRGFLVLCEQRFLEAQVRSALPAWIREEMVETTLDGFGGLVKAWR